MLVKRKKEVYVRTCTDRITWLQKEIKFMIYGVYKMNEDENAK